MLECTAIRVTQAAPFERTNLLGPMTASHGSPAASRRKLDGSGTSVLSVPPVALAFEFLESNLEESLQTNRSSPLHTLNR